MKHCPNPECSHLLRTGSAPEYIDTIQKCANCQTELLEGEAPVQVEKKKEVIFDSQLVLIATYRDPTMAHLAKSNLESAGIPSFIRDEHIVSTQWLFSNAVGGVKLEVPALHAEEALELLNTEQPGNKSNTLDINETEQTLEDQCPNCGSSDISTIDLRRKSGVLSLLTGLPILFWGKKFKCNSCKHKWK